ncbi:hypothetical protein O6H91_01G174500 [Diphasiastrum complanatum]|uniref:Uncharacterized protein n=1 Tax=Diphasiastrum complanatum TaxID=34168 RepID=A0ACC2EZ55_DIPCM|nr:hypothetical protein O6H91_01G174500 [Diphasiastrum complanatum]
MPFFCLLPRSAQSPASGGSSSTLTTSCSCFSSCISRISSSSFYVEGYYVLPLSYPSSPRRLEHMHASIATRISNPRTIAAPAISTQLETAMWMFTIIAGLCASKHTQAAWTSSS